MIEITDFSSHIHNNLARKKMQNWWPPDLSGETAYITDIHHRIHHRYTLKANRLFISFDQVFLKVVVW